QAGGAGRPGVSRSHRAADRPWAGLRARGPDAWQRRPAGRLMTRRSRPARRRPSAHAHRPGTPLRRRVRRALPARGRIAAGLLADIAALPLVDDRRVASRDLIVGDRIDAAALAAALQLSAVEPAALGSQAVDLEVRLTDADGFLLVSHEPDWQADFGFYPDA